MSVIKKMSTSALENKEKGAITIVETLVVLGVGIAVLMFYAVQQGDRLEVDGARAAGRDIANYTRAASVWIAESPPSTPGNYGIADLQDCADPAGARFLPCAFTEDITIRYATNAAGEPVNFADLVIEVTLPPEGPTGSIDFGVFRQGDDVNDDGFPDSRPDLAAIALQHASEETPSGVFGYFALQFAREDLTGLVTDPDDPGFDLVEVENIARIQAQVGAHSAAAPFLRVDGSNQMQNGITFVNGVQLAMNADRLEIDAPGGITFETDVRVENLTATEIDATTMETETVTVSDELKVDVADGVTGTGFDRLDQSADIVRIDGDVVRLSQDIDTNRTAIDLNRSNIAGNVADVAVLQNDVQGNRNQINTNTQQIVSNAQNIEDMGTQIGLLIDDMETLNEVSVCSPSYGQATAEARAANPGFPYTGGGSCSCRSGASGCTITGSHSCRWPTPYRTHTSSSPTGNSTTYNYKSRDTFTLMCVDETWRLYDQCRIRRWITGCVNPH